ncbi:hypothetical protein DBR33_10095 [Stenotrophomonas sp. HMWF022]|jgi:hypothetical protein|nr:hypothetical protein DBR33_10095 [Stenotrophomonas sp. HMWF022]
MRVIVPDLPMFDDYLANPIIYDRLEQCFLDHFDAGIHAAGLSREDFRRPHYNTFFVDGTKFRDANPIFSAKHLPSGNIVRVVICESDAEYTELHNWVGDNDAQVELCLFIALADMQRAMETTVVWAKQQAS